MRLDPQPFADLTDCPEGVGLLAIVKAAGHLRQPLATCSLSNWLALKETTLRGVMGTSIPVLGFRPIRSRLSRKMKLPKPDIRSEEHTSELQSLMRISYA